MGQKVNANGLRVGVIKDWQSKWYAKGPQFADNLVEDYKIREYIKKNEYQAGISKIIIERNGGGIIIHIIASKPGMIIGRGGVGIEQLKKNLAKLTDQNITVSIIEVEQPDLDAQLIAQSIAQQIERRISYRRAMKQAMQRAMRAGAKGIKTEVSGRLNGVEIARRDHYSEGNVPMQTLRADINYGFAEADTTYGKIGVKVWVNLGEILTGREDILEKYKSAKENKRDNRQRKNRRGNRNRSRRTQRSERS